MPTQRRRIATRELVRIEPSADGTGLSIVFVDTDGGQVTVVIPVGCIGAILDALPAHIPAPATGDTQAVSSWRLEAGTPPREMHLTFLTQEGHASRFRITPAQIGAIATLATYGWLNAQTARTRH